MTEAIVFPAIVRPLFEPTRIKVMYGGTGAGKTQAAARAIVTQAAQRTMFVVCLLETQASIEESAQRLIMSIAEEYDLADVFMKNKMSVSVANRSEIVFEQVSKAGRMLENADVVWVDNAHMVPYSSWNTIMMGARKPGSEVWVTMNPGLGNGAAYDRFIKESVYRPALIEMNYRTNEYFPDSMEIERQRMLREDPEEYQHVWEGVPVGYESPGPSTIVGDDGTIEEISPDSPMAVLRRISMDKSETTQSRIDAARAILPYIHKKQPIAVEGLGQAAGVMGTMTPERLAALSDVDLANMLSILQGGGGRTIDGEVVR